MRERLLKIAIYAAGAVCMYVFIAVRILPMFNLALVEKMIPNYGYKTRYGELYYFSQIRHFREKGLPPAMDRYDLSDRHPSPEKSKMLTFGDSFFEYSRHKQFPEVLSDTYNIPVHMSLNDKPLEYLLKSGYQKGEPKIVIMERVERYIPIQFGKKHESSYNPEPVLSPGHSLFKKIKDLIFYERSEELYDVMLKRSYLSSFLYSVVATIKFDLFGYISTFTPKYSLNEDIPWMFYYDECNDKKTSFYYPFTDEDIDSICDNMSDLARQMQEKYNLYVVYMPLPAKYTLYHTIINQDRYNNFLPRLYQGLDKKGVRYINVYDSFVNCDTLLYYGTDTHWNQKGIDIALDKTREYLKNDSTLNKILNQHESSYISGRIWHQN